MMIAASLMWAGAGEKPEQSKMTLRRINSLFLKLTISRIFLARFFACFCRQRSVLLEVRVFLDDLRSKQIVEILEGNVKELVN